MKIITRLADIGMEVETDIPKEEAVQLVFEALQNGFQGQANDEAYFSESFLKESFVFGCDAPDKVCQIACRWNEDARITDKRAIDLINALIDHMVNEAGGHAREVIGVLLDVGFTSDELVNEFLFTRSDVEDCLEEDGEESDEG